MGAVLLIDDDRGDMLLLGQALAEAAPDAVVHTARTAQEGLARLREDGIALVLLDLNMPGTSGFEALREIRGDPDLAMTPVIVLTTSAAGADVLQAYRDGANAFITKPSNLKATIEVMRAIKAFWLDHALLPEDL